MFNLEQAIAEWREHLAASGIKSSQVLDELESHLREDMEQQARPGSTAQQTFANAVQRLGQATVLECEFDKVGTSRETHERVKHTFLTLAGIPNRYLTTSMNTSTSNIEPGWATYLKATAFLVPAICLWALSIIFIVPKLQQICVDAGLPGPSSFWNLAESNFKTTSFFRDNWLFVGGAMVLILILLEWRSTKWPRYRRATVGVGTFALNSVVLISIFMMILTAVMAAPALLHHAK